MQVVKRMTIEITPKESEEMHAFVATVCKDIGPRASCSAAEAKAAEFIKAEMQKNCDDVVVEPFTCAIEGLHGWIRIDVVLIAISILVFLSTPFVLPGIAGIGLHAASLAIVIAGWIITWKQFFSYDEFIDRFLKQSSSQNVVGSIKPAGVVEHVIAFSGHHDSAPRFNLLEYFGGAGYGGIILWGFGAFGTWTITLLVTIVMAIGGLDLGGIYTFVPWFIVIGAPAMVILWFFKSSGERGNVVPGAVDNISAVSVVLAIGKYIRDNPEIVPSKTEIRLISFGCEEIGLRGAYRYVEAHRAELKNTDFKLVNMDGLQSPKRFTIFSFEPTTRTLNDQRVTDGLISAAKRSGVDVRTFGNQALDRVAGFFTGGTDAAAFSKAKIAASTFGAMDISTYINNYHTSRDTPDRIEPGVLEGALKICLNYIEKAGEI